MLTILRKNVLIELSQYYDINTFWKIPFQNRVKILMIGNRKNKSYINCIFAVTLFA